MTISAETSVKKLTAPIAMTVPPPAGDPPAPGRARRGLGSLPGDRLVAVPRRHLRCIAHGRVHVELPPTRVTPPGRVRRDLPPHGRMDQPVGLVKAGVA